MGRQPKYASQEEREDAIRLNKERYETSVRGKNTRECYRTFKYPRLSGPRMLVDAPLPTPAICAFAEFAIPFDDPHFKRGAEGKPIPDIYPYDAPPPYRPSYFRNVPKRVSFSNVEELERLVMGRLWYHEKENDRDRCILYNLLERRTLLAKWSEEATRMFELFETLTNTAPQGDVYIDAMVVLHARWTARSFMRLRNLKPLQVRARGSVGSSQELNSNITYLPTQKQGVQSTHF